MLVELLLFLLHKPQAAAILGTWFTFNQYWKMFTLNAEDEWTACILDGYPINSPPLLFL
jgi:hypothetical protein